MLPDADRRSILQAIAIAAAGLTALPANSQTRSGKGAAMGPMIAKPRVAMLVHPKMVAQDLIGPWTAFNMVRGAELHLVWKDLQPVSTELGLSVTPTTTLADCPADLDVLFVPGGLDGTIALMEDEEVLAFLADRGTHARYVTSVCTGSLLLGAAGLLRGYKATSHWYVRDYLALMGATPVHDRIVQDRNRITGGGVTAGLDFGLTIVAALQGQETAERIQLVLEYAPAPPFNAGTPETAPKHLVDTILKARAPALEQVRSKAERIGAGFAKR